MSQIKSNDIAIVVLQNPREKVLGVVHEINTSGIFIRGIDLIAFDDWCRAISNNEPFYSMQDNFFPMWRIEKIVKDESAVDLPSMAEQFTKRTGLKIEDF